MNKSYLMEPELAVNQNIKENYLLDYKLAANQNIKEKNFWLNKLSGEPAKINFPYDYKGKESNENPFDKITFEFSGDVSSNLMTLSTGSLHTLNVILMAGLVALLYRYTGSHDIIVGAPIYKQDFEEDFINRVLVLRNRLEPSITFKDLLVQVSQTIVEATENYNYPVELLPEQLNIPFPGDGDFPLFDIVSLLENIHDKRYIRHINTNMIFSFLGTGGTVEGVVEYNPSRYRKSTIERIISHLTNLLEDVLTDINLQLEAANILAGEEKRQLLSVFNDTKTDFPRNKSLHRLFEEQVNRTPDHTAVVFADKQLTYRELNKKAHRLALVLRKKGVGPDTIAGLMVERSINMIIGILGILKAGGAYLPIEPDYPEERIKFMLADSNARVLLKKSEIRISKYETNPNDRNSNDRNEMTLDVVLNFEHLDFEFLNGCPSLGLSDFEFRASDLPSSRDLAYIIYSSGTTGKPKGILTTHANAVRVVKNSNYIDINESDRVLQLSNYAFDGSVFDIYGALLNGSTLVMLNEQDVLELDKLPGLISRKEITVFFVTTALFNAIVELDIQCLSNVRKILFGGERVSAAHAGNAFAALGKNRILHMYGPTETTVYATYYYINEIDERLGTIPIGKALANTAIYILDKHLKPVPIGVRGEIFVGGDGIARGYQNAPELTGEKFITSPFKKGDRLYKTGDMARWLPDGNIEFSGRKDHQVKIRGFRIELEEIEIRLLNHKDIREAVVLVKENGGSEGIDKVLCAYIVSDKEFEISELREYLSHELPDYMIPAYFVKLKELPLTSNGKIDRKALPEPYGIGLSSKSDYIAPKNAMEEKLVEIWRDVLGRDGIGVNDNFFEIGGDSIKAIQISSRLKKTGYQFELKDLFAHQTILELTPYIKEEKEDVSLTPVPGQDFTYKHLPKDFLNRLTGKYPGGIEDIYPLTPMQEGMLFHALYDNSSSLFINQSSLRFHEELNIPAVEKSFDELLKRFDILRTVFIYEGIEEMGRALQLVLRERKIEICFEDISDKMTWSDKEQFLKEFREKDRQKRFDLSKDLLLRAAVIKLDQSEYELIWTYHCILMDGWSRSILSLEFNEIYNRYLRGSDRQPGPVTPFKNYIDWLEKRDRNESKKYWQKYLEGYKETAAVPRKKTPPDKAGGFVSECVSIVFNREKTGMLNDMARRNRMTLNILFQAIWAIILGKYTGKNDVVFGHIVSGRPPGIEGIETIVGLFTNMNPVRIRFHENMTFIKLLKQVQEDAFNSEPHHYYPLVEIQSGSPLKQNLFDHFLSFGNVPGSSDLKDAVGTGREVGEGLLAKLGGLEGFEQTSYDLTLYVITNETANMFLSYNANVYSRDFMEKIALHIEEAVDKVIKNENTRLKDIEVEMIDLAAIESTIFDGAQPDFDF